MAMANATAGPNDAANGFPGNLVPVGCDSYNAHEKGTHNTTPALEVGMDIMEQWINDHAQVHQRFLRRLISYG